MPKAKHKTNSYFYRIMRKEVNSILQNLNNNNIDAPGSNPNNVECLKHINIGANTTHIILMTIRIMS